MKPQDLYTAGDLKAAIPAALEAVKAQPADAGARGFLCELFAFAGEWERADKQLDLLGHQDPKAAMGVGLFRHLLRADETRQQFYTDGRLPEFLGQPSEALKLHLEASILLREGKTADAAKLLAEAEEKRPKVKGTHDGHVFDDFRDADDLTACFFEVLTSNGKYYWVPFENVELLEMRPPVRPRDLLWARAHMIVREGPDGEVYLPTIYAGSFREADDRLRLGRATDWRGGDGVPTRGVGLRTFLVGDEGKSILELKTATFEKA
ncbi:MAG: type VI secretion system accessory protein TagJ [Gemmataceae bacterium]